MTAAAEPTAVRGFAQAYASGEAFDEMVEPDGALRPHWRMFVSMLDDLGPDEIARRWTEAKRLIHDNGVTHNVYGDENGLDRPWNLDAVPLLTESVAWKKLSDGLTQRARLLDRLLADLYGPRTAISSGILPAELVFTSPAFLRPCHDLPVPQDRWLHLYAADLVRTPNGGHLVLSDRTQAPFGAGYTLENRIVLSRVLPNVFRQCNVERLAPFFVTLRRMLAGLAPANRDNPRVVLLTPGPYSETYFEHAYLARYLGYTLVQGNDLTVRDEKVFLKTLGGLHRVDVIFRRVDDDACDPLELTAIGNAPGVPGLLQAVRAGNVAVANALGSGVLQAAAFLPYLPQLCRHLLGEEIATESVRTWWCGDGTSLAYVLDNLPTLVVKSAFPSRGADPWFGAELSRSDLSNLASRIREHPGRYVAQEQVMAATTPALVGDHVEPRRFVMRAYLTASDDGYALMPGGLTRVTRTAESFVVSLQKGGGSKDIWVQGDSPVLPVTLLPQSSEKVALSRGGADLPSRVADDLYWLGRYAQRAESLARLARSVVGRTIEQGGDGGRTLAVLTNALVHRQVAPAAGVERPLLSFLFDNRVHGGLRGDVSHVYRLARLLRDRISVDAWRVLQSIDADVTAFQVNRDEPLQGVGDLLNGLVLGFAAFTGLSTDSMTRGMAYRFLDIGQRVERAVATTQLLRDTILLAGDAEASLLEAVLEVADSSLTYRRRYLTHLEPHAVVDLLLADETNPRSVLFQLVTIEDHLKKVPRDATHPHQQRDLQGMLRLRTAIQLADVETCCGPKSGGASLAALLGETIERLEGVSVDIAQTFFAHAKAASGRLGRGGVS